MKNILALHRWLGVIACVAVLMFASSGILHPVMSWLQPQPAQFAPPRVELPTATLSLRAVLEKQGIEHFSAASLVQLPQAVAYRVQVSDGARYLRADNGDVIDNGERIHAEYLARHFLGDDTASISVIEKQERFDSDYVFVNRLLPAWRINFARDDGMRVYVDTAGNRLATLTDAKKRIFQSYFRALHDFDFLDDYNALRIGIMLILLFATFSTAIAGVVMYVRLKRAAQRLKNMPVRRWHRRLSLAIAVVTFSFTVSGTWHLLQSQREVQLPALPTTEFSTAALGTAAPDSAFVLLSANEQPCYRKPLPFKPKTAQHEHHHHADTSTAAPEPQCVDTHTSQALPHADRQIAEQLARHYARSQSAVKMMELITQFGGEYGFINKRLPVWKVQFENDATRWYVETSSNALALRADDADAREGWVFSIFHKARFIGDAYKTARDVFLMASAAGMLVVSLLGLWLFVRRFR